jgi:protein arginine N-methyltransferase 1
MSIEYHRRLLADRARNRALLRALKRVIRPGESTVADVGAGTGFLGFLASRLGAKSVYLYERGAIHELSRRLARGNRIARCEFLPEHSTLVLDAPSVDVVVSETLGNFAYEENIVETLNDARRFLKPGGTIIPQRVECFVAPVVSERLYRPLRAWDRVGFNLDFSAARELSLNNMYVHRVTPRDLLAGPKCARRWDAVDFRRRNSSLRRGTANWGMDRATTIYGLAMWWRAGLAPGVELTTSPFAPRTHWEQLYLPVEEPVALQRGDELTATIRSDSRSGHGVYVDWRFAWPGGSQHLDMRRGLVE